MPFLDNTDFVDLYLGVDFADLKELAGAQAPVRRLEGAEFAKAMELRAVCLAAYGEHGEPEFSQRHGGVGFRVTIIANHFGGDAQDDLVVILRRVQDGVMDFDEIGVEADITSALTHEKFRGLVLICGEQGVGKTTTASSLLVKRTVLHGGISVSVEQPPEIQTGGAHGKGRIIQVGVSRRLGSFSEQLIRAMRVGTSNLLIGEIRDEETAGEAIRHANNGLFVGATIHASGPAEGIERLLALTGHREAIARRLLSLGLACVIHQSLTRLPGSATTTKIRPAFRTLMVNGRAYSGVRSLIREGLAHQLESEIDAQAGRAMWQP